MSTYAEPNFVDPLTGVFAYAAWNSDPRRRGPFVRPSLTRRSKILEINDLAAALQQHRSVTGVRVFEATVMLPIPKLPHYDIVMLVHADTFEAAAAIADDPRLKEAHPATLFLATNAARFGTTDNGDRKANILLNHFTGTAQRAAAVSTWRDISAWFADKTGIDNSTLLQTEESAPYLLVNCARLPGGVVSFMLNQILRPSFHQFVRGLLKRNGLTSLPLFVRPVSP